MSVTRIEVGALNIVASPHPKGVYRNLLNAIADKEATLWGPDRGKITRFQELEDKSDLLYGRILIWSEIDPDGRWLNKKKNVEATPEEKKEIADAIPENYEPNFRSFNFVFMETKHRLVFEVRNELGEHFAPSRAERLFQRLFDRHLPEDSPAVDVTAVPEDDTLERILAIPKLRLLEVSLKRPNPDDVDEEAERVLERLEREAAGSRTVVLRKAPKRKTLTPDKRTKTQAAVAARGNGFVTGEGKDEAGKPVYESTKEHPKIRQLDVEGQVSFATFLRSLRLF